MTTAGEARHSSESLTTPRLRLRHWRDADREPFAALNGDPEVMEHFGRTFTRDESDATIDRYERDLRRDRIGRWAIERLEDGALLGSAGLAHVEFDAPFTPAVDIGWRLARPYWGAGYAFEAAQRVLGFAFEELGLPEVVAYATPGNARSLALMERLGMTRDPSGDFADTRELGTPPPRYLLYRISASGPTR